MAGSNLTSFAGIGTAVAGQVGNVFENIVTIGISKIGSAGAFAAGVASVIALSTLTNAQKSDTQGSFYNKNINFVYPYDLVQDKVGRNQTLTLIFYDYVRPSVTKAAVKNSVGAITFPLPNDLIDSQAIKFDEIGNSPALGAALNQYVPGSGAQALIDITKGALGGATTQGAAALLNQGGNLALGNDVANKVIQALGLSQNPFMSVLFEAPLFKRYTFRWIFSPDNEKDANSLKLCVNKLRFHCLPGISGFFGGTLLQYPSLCLPFITPSGYAFDFKHCVIEKVAVDIVPGRQPSFFNNGAPSAIALTLSLLESEIWVREDIATDIGTNKSPEQTTNYDVPNINQLTQLS